MATSSAMPEVGDSATPTRRRGRPPRTEAQRAAQRRRLIDAAMDAIRSGGPDVSIDDLAAAAGVSKPVLYDEFGGKLGVADAIAVVLAEQVERDVLDELTRARTFDIEVAMGAIVGALVTLIDDEPQLYQFLVRSIRTSDRGFLDNALVRVIHERAALVMGLLGPSLHPDHLAVLTDGVFGFLFAAVESWQATRRLEKEELVRVLTGVIGGGFQALAT
jgi:AcrR family transcriptional regulator